MASRQTAPIVLLPTELLLLIVASIDLADIFHLAQTSRRLRLLFHQNHLPIPNNELLRFWSGISRHSQNIWACRPCRSFHRVNPLDVPRYMGWEPRCQHQTQDTVTGLGPGICIREAHVQLALKFTRMMGSQSQSQPKASGAVGALSQSNRIYLKKIMARRTVGLPVTEAGAWQRAPWSNEYYTSVSRARVVPLIADGRFLMHVDYRFGVGVEEWADKIMHQFTWICPHLCKSSHGARLSREWWTWSRFRQFDEDVSDACDADGGEVTEGCGICPLDYAISSRTQPLSEVRLQVWVDLGGEKVPDDDGWKVHDRERPRECCVSHELGSVRRMFEERMAMEMNDAKMVGTMVA